MQKLTAICFALAQLTFGVASAQDNMKNDTMKDDASKKAVQVTGKVSGNHQFAQPLGASHKAAGVYGFVRRNQDKSFTFRFLCNI